MKESRRKARDGQAEKGELSARRLSVSTEPPEPRRWKGRQGSGGKRIIGWDGNPRGSQEGVPLRRPAQGEGEIEGIGQGMLDRPAHGEGFSPHRSCQPQDHVLFAVTAPGFGGHGQHVPFPAAGEGRAGREGTGRRSGRPGSGRTGSGRREHPRSRRARATTSSWPFSSL